MLRKIKNHMTRVDVICLSVCHGSFCETLCGHTARTMPICCVFSTVEQGDRKPIGRLLIFIRIIKCVRLLAECLIYENLVRFDVS
ncbi:hypothetical protein D3C76_1165480 [compost metagenome]